MTRESPLPGQWHAYVDFDEIPPEGEYTRPSEETDLEKANLLTSKVKDHPRYALIDPLYSPHKVVIDLDLPAQLIESSTPGHHHLIIDHEMSWGSYVRLLEVMTECGLIEPGYLRASVERGYTSVRLPWIKKGEPRSHE